MMAQASRENRLSKRLENLVQAEFAKQNGQMPADPLLAKVSLEDIRQEITAIVKELSSCLDGKDHTEKTARDMGETLLTLLTALTSA